MAEEGDGWLMPLDRNPDEPPTRNTPQPWKCTTDRISLTNQAATADIPRTYVRFTADKVPGNRYLPVFAESWKRAQEGGWRLRELDTIHQISPDPAPKAAVLLELFPD